MGPEVELATAFVALTCANGAIPMKRVNINNHVFIRGSRTLVGGRISLVEFQPEIISMTGYMCSLFKEKWYMIRKR